IINPELPVEKKYQSFVQNVVQPMVNYMQNVSKFTEMAVEKGVFNGEVKEILNYLDSALRSEITAEYINLISNFNAFYFYGIKQSVESKDIQNVIDFVKYVAEHHEEFAKKLIPGFEPDIDLVPIKDKDVFDFKKFNYVALTPLLKEYVSPGEVLVNAKKGIKDPQKLIEESIVSIYHFFMAQGSSATMLVKVNYYNPDETIRRVKLNNYKFRR
ncbi:hypothetical protein, partial [Desulfurobacterium sp.]|uniref:hypothetical protein n=1 Tax=Desulfurobacterium sp. TaxID=2004706 RepID=UPI0026023AF4